MSTNKLIPDPNILHYEHIITITSKDEDILSLFSKIIEKFVLGAEDIILKEKKYPEDVCYIENIIKSAWQKAEINIEFNAVTRCVHGRNYHLEECSACGHNFEDRPWQYKNNN